ncbi:uncharacterized protein LOC119590902 isoform X2 [Penaeus monodon]|uniref:uncharacterized protein LOC119590902 isoform X2 n=1 Tax=Penaeus monodon TaxID=6687 RepID=UPI0018A70169|nr:uncharacterized protein LOC119590902 isoform X2 [Penaeus monodon]
MMTAFLRRLAVVRGVLLLASPAVIWAQTKSLFPAEEPTPREPLPSCNGAVLGDCLMPGPRPMSWEAAHRHCRSEGGFLLEREELGHFDHLWTSRYQTPLQKNLTMPVSVLSWPALNSTWPGGEATLEELTWTALTSHGGQYQWLSRIPGLDFFVEWQERPPPMARDCAAFNLTSRQFRLLACDRQLRFFCILRRPSGSPDMVPEDEVELRVTTSVKSNHGWVEVSHEKLIELSLTCTAHDARTGALLAKDLPVFWSKDDVYVYHHNKKIFPVLNSRPHQVGCAALGFDRQHPRATRDLLVRNLAPEIYDQTSEQ